MAGELILYTTEDGAASVRLRAEGGSVWITQAEMAALFQTTPQNITLHVKAIYAEGELQPEATCKEHLQVRQEGGRQVRRALKHYNLDMILAVGYRVRSLRGTQFRQWATTHLREYLVKGFVMDDERLKEPGGWDYFDELLERIRDIRASEKRFYQKVRDIYATAVDYDPKSEAAQLFFKKVQNKMLWAVTGHTAAELISGRADPALPNMGLTSFKGSRVRQGDVTIAKNYLQAAEIDELNRIVVMYLDYAEDMARRRKPMTMREWEDKLDAFLQFNERDVLTHAGKISAQVAERLALERYAEFDARRREAERLAADAEDVQALEQIERQWESKPAKGKKS
ncbi:virulence RhuM family protein [Methylococcus capsulatus]|uniref:virulence RhuM family protein n=1 Tax=Methylococcus capsulatus TaxID=414 RepID=UPI001C532962|nr:virulence RhuM family protein [Methylococcus capsulatus]QXP87472.1 virulence RhuM family protein [Methylococcus capsulatus]UQN12480.1 virulence RhuM family protein [Methylococcus capsulatus]